jgi:NADPH-dependent ferric siderophore reductase
MRQIELTGPGLARLRCRPGAHLVVRIPGARRVYSIWRHDPRSASLSIRVALHDAGGPGCEWAAEAAVDDRISVEMPRSKMTLEEGARFHLLVGDETGRCRCWPCGRRCAALRPYTGSG